MEQDWTFLRRLAVICAAAVMISAIWQSIPLLQSHLLSGFAEPRVVTPRGDLAQDERSTSELFETASLAVVYISTAERIVDRRTRNIHSIPRGTGSGFV